MTDDEVPFCQVEPVFFTTRDADIHHRKWKYMNAAFSPRMVQDLETYMDPNIRLLVGHFEAFAAKSGVVDFPKWGMAGVTLRYHKTS